MSFEVGDNVKCYVNINNSEILPFAGKIITYENNEYSVSISGYGNILKFKESDLSLLTNNNSDNNGDNNSNTAQLQ